jgi:hypothetical protein
MISLLELQKEVHQTALDKGWWEEDRNVGEMIALVHSEISEAHEAADENRFETTFSNGKPEGFYIECADVVIRVLDLGHVGGFEFFLPELPSVDVSVEDVDRHLNLAHRAVSEALEKWRMKKDTEASFFMHLNLAVDSLCYLCGTQKLLEAVQLKAAYNKTRPYRHGGKAA